MALRSQNSVPSVYSCATCRPSVYSVCSVVNPAFASIRVLSWATLPIPIQSRIDHHGTHRTHGKWVLHRRELRELSDDPGGRGSVLKAGRPARLLSAQGDASTARPGQNELSFYRCENQPAKAQLNANECCPAAIYLLSFCKFTKTVIDQLSWS